MTDSASQWFDGFAQTHRFQLIPSEDGKSVSRVLYNSRHSCSGLIEKVRREGDLSAITFGQKQDPCENFFRKVMSSFQAVAGRGAGEASDVNIGVTIQKNLPGLPNLPGVRPPKGTSASEKTSSATAMSSIWLKSDNSTLQQLNPTSLEPVGFAEHVKFHPDLKGPLAAAHSRTDPVTGDTYNFNLQVGRQATYRVFCISASTGKTSILATMAGGPILGAYLHSFMLTENYVLLCIFDAYLAKGGIKMLWTRNILDAMEFFPDRTNKWLVIDRRHGKGLVGIYESDPFFAFHPINAWEQPSETEPGKTDLIAEIPCYKDLDILKRFYYDNMKGSSPTALNYVGNHADRARANLVRWKLPNVGTETVPVTNPLRKVERVFTAPSEETVELPTFNPKYATKPSRYVYGVSDGGHSTFLDGLIKYDSQTRTAKTWRVHAHSPGEAIFLADPEGGEEDDGILLSVVLDGTRGKSYLLVMDAKSFFEIGRAEMETVVSFGFHGAHIKND